MSELVDVRVVQEEGDAPMAFLWRGRLYVVREVLGHWRERRDWWSTAAARALHGDEKSPERPVSEDGPSFAVWSGDRSEAVGELPGKVPGGVPGRAHADPAEGRVAVGRSGAAGRSRGSHAGHGAPVRRRPRGRSAAVDHGVEMYESAGGHDDAGGAGQPHDYLLETECEVWRVEASTGRAFGNGVYDLSRTPSSAPAADSWRLLQVAD